MATVDNFWIIVSWFGLAIFFLAMLLFWGGISDAGNDLWDSTEGEGIRSNAQSAINTFDFILVIVYVGLHLGILATAYLLRTHPVNAPKSTTFVSTGPMI